MGLEELPQIDYRYLVFHHKGPGLFRRWATDRHGAQRWPARGSEAVIYGAGLLARRRGSHRLLDQSETTSLLLAREASRGISHLVSRKQCPEAVYARFTAIVNCNLMPWSIEVVDAMLRK
jgi:hypothetical protein